MGKVWDAYWSFHHDRVQKKAWKNPVWAEIEQRRLDAGDGGSIMFLSEEHGLGWKEERIQSEITSQLGMHNWIWKAHHFWDNKLSPKRHWRGLKWFWQRGKRGYADIDLWNFSFYLARLISEGTTWLAEHSHGYPGNDEFPTFESWADKLKELSGIFDRLAKNDYDDIPGDFYEWQENASSEERHQHYLEANRAREEDLDEGFRMLRHVWDSLWD